MKAYRIGIFRDQAELNPVIGYIFAAGGRFV